jgi:hypothetical protein
MTPGAFSGPRALPAFGASHAEVQLVVAGYGPAYAVMLISRGRLGAQQAQRDWNEDCGPRTSSWLTVMSAPAGWFRSREYRLS